MNLIETRERLQEIEAAMCYIRDNSARYESLGEWRVKGYALETEFEDLSIEKAKLMDRLVKLENFEMEAEENTYVILRSCAEKDWGAELFIKDGDYVSMIKMSDAALLNITRKAAELVTERGLMKLEEKDDGHNTQTGFASTSGDD